MEVEEGMMWRRNRMKRKWERMWRMRRKIWWVLLLGNEMPPSVFLLDRKKSAGLTG